jgi:16S rRNA (cytosine1402-N4)-methyltransferase
MIIQNRPFSSAKQLADFLKKHLKTHKKIHPATLPFQAIRIEVNQELAVLDNFLESIGNFGLQGTTVAIISFHSLEDKIVKEYFKKWSKNCICDENVMRCECGNNHKKGKIITKKPIVPSQDELKVNKRSRSSKLRIFKFD